MSLAGAVIHKDWTQLFRRVSDRMRSLSWTASRAFNLFVHDLVLPGTFEIQDYNSFKAIVRSCFTVASSGASRNEGPVATWLAQFQRMMVQRSNPDDTEFSLVDKRGMANIITHASNAYAANVTNYLSYGLRDHYVRLLKVLGVANHKMVALRVLNKSVMKRKGNFSFALSSDDEFAASRTKRDTSAEAAVVSAVEREFQLMGKMETYGDAFRFLRHIQGRLEDDYAERLSKNKGARPGRSFNIAPLTSMKPCFIRVDKTSLDHLYTANFKKNGAIERPSCVEDVLPHVKARPRMVIGDSFQTDGTQLVVPYLQETHKTVCLSEEEHAESLSKEREHKAKVAAYYAQKARLDAGEELADGEDRILWVSVKPRYKADTSKDLPLDGSFADAKNGVFSRESAKATSDATRGEAEVGKLPAIIAIDPGQKNIWCASLYNPNKRGDPNERGDRDEATQLLNLTRPAYNHKTGLNYFRKWQDKRKKETTEFGDALDQLCESSLKGVNVGVNRAARRADFELKFKEQFEAFHTLTPFYGSRSFGKQRFLLQRRKQAFDDKFINDAVQKFRTAAGTKDFVVAYGDGSFPLTMKGMDGGGSAHARLMRLLSKKVRIVITSEHRTTKACPRCQNRDEDMRQPLGRAKYKDRNGVLRRKEIHGLSQCRSCGTLWARDYAATLNIGRSFVRHFLNGVAEEYLARRRGAAEAD